MRTSIKIMVQQFLLGLLIYALAETLYWQGYPVSASTNAAIAFALSVMGSAGILWLDGRLYVAERSLELFFAISGVMFFVVLIAAAFVSSAELIQANVAQYFFVVGAAIATALNALVGWVVVNLTQKFR